MISHNNESMPLVTIITPAYNRASFIDETIESVLNQSYPNLEYIVIDDGSKDNTLEVIRKYGDRLKCESHPNMGETRTVNKGFSMAKGDIIGVVNSDDPLLLGAVRKIVDFMIQHPDVLVVYPDWKMIDGKGNLIEHIKTYEYSYIDMLRWHHCVPGPGTFFRRSVVNRLQGRDPQFSYVGDFDFWLRAGLLGPFARIPETLATFRVHPDSASVNQVGDKMAKEHIVLVDKIFSLPGLPPEVLRIKNEAYSSAYYIGGVVCGNLIRPKRSYYIKALLYCPWKYLFEYRNRLRTILGEFLGFVYVPLRVIVKCLRSMGIRLGAKH